jgi:hypothetical protein
MCLYIICNILPDVWKNKHMFKECDWMAEDSALLFETRLSHIHKYNNIWLHIQDGVETLIQVE